MKHLSRLATLLLAAVLLLGLLAGCGSKPAATPGEDTPSPSTPSAPTDDSTAPSTDDTAPADDGTTVSENWLPLVDELVTMTAWGSQANSYDPNLKTEDTAFFRWAEAQTNVRTEWTMVSSATMSEQFNLMMVSGNYDDMIYMQARYYPNGLANAIDEEVIVDITDYVEGGTAPHYQALRMSDEKIRMDTMLDGGTIPGFYRILDSEQCSWLGWAVNTKMAADAGYDDVDSLRTIEDYHQMFKAMTALDYTEFACDTSSTGMDNILLAAFDIPRGYSYDNDFRHVGNQIEYNYTTQDFYNYLTTMRQWYEEGIFRSDFYGGGWLTIFNDADKDTIASGGVGCLQSLITYVPILTDLSGCEYRAVAGPLQEGRTARNVSQTDAAFSRVETVFMSISTACEDPALAVRYLDFFYSDEAFLAKNYGAPIDEPTYTFTDDGDPMLTPFMTDNPDGYTLSQMMSNYGCFFLVGRYDWNYMRNNMDDSAKHAVEIWDINWDRDADLYTLPQLMLSQTEAETYSTTYNDIQTYVTEMVLKFIIGQESLDEASYAQYCENIKAMNIQTCIDMVQAAYDRYLER